MALFEKTNVPIDTVQGSSDNYSAEIAKVQELVMKTSRTNSGQESWTSSTSGVTYNTSDYASDPNIYNKGETGLYNLLIYLYGNRDITGTGNKSFILTATNYNDLMNAAKNASNSVSAITSGSTAAAVANKLGTANVGSSTTPIYLSGGTPTACTSLSLNTSGNAASATVATRLSSNAGEASVPVFFNNGVPSACSSLSLNTTGSAAKLATGRTLKVNLASNNASSAFDGTANITDIGVSGVLPVANGGTGASSLSNLSVGSAASATVASKLSNTAKIGDTDKPVYFNASGVPVACGSSLAVSITGNAATATSATSATTASKLGSSNLGNASTPIYLNGGTATACSAYAGGTAVTLNGSSKAASTASFYAPTGSGAAGQYLRSNGDGSAPTYRASVYIRTSGYPSNPVTGDICIHY